MFRTVPILSLIFLLSFLTTAQGEVLSTDTQWQGHVEITEDVVVPSGITLSVAPGTIIKIHPSENTRIDPEYLSHQTEILVRGKIKAESSSGEIIRFTGIGKKEEERWGGIII